MSIQISQTWSAELFVSTISDGKAVREISQKHKEDVSKILQEINILGTDVKEIKADSFANRRGLPESRSEDEIDETKMSNLILQEIKDTILNEVKATVRSHVRAEMKGVRLELRTELKHIRQTLDENSNKYGVHSLSSLTLLMTIDIRRANLHPISRLRNY